MKLTKEFYLCEIPEGKLLDTICQVISNDRETDIFEIKNFMGGNDATMMALCLFLKADWYMLKN